MQYLLHKDEKVEIKIIITIITVHPREGKGSGWPGLKCTVVNQTSHSIKAVILIDFFLPVSTSI